MPVFNNYDAKGELINSQVEPLSESNLERFIELYGEEKAQIYMEAFAEFTNQLENIVYDRTDGQYFSHTLHKVKRMVIELYYHNRSVLESGKKLMDLEVSKNSVNSDASLQP